MIGLIQESIRTRKVGMFGISFNSEWNHWISELSKPLHGRNRWRLQNVITGILFASGRHTVTSWWRAIAVGSRFRSYYYFLDCVGRKILPIASTLLMIVFKHLASNPSPVFMFALDDSSTKRFGPKVQGAGYHHNPTPGPAGAKFLYGHNWVVASWLQRHPCFGLISLPLLGLLYVRKKEISRLPASLGVTFRSKLELAADLIHWLGSHKALFSKPVWLIADGFYAKKAVFQAARQENIVVVSRIRTDSKLFEPPPKLNPSQKRGRGQPRKYGEKRLDLRKRAGQKRGWTKIEVLATDGRRMTKYYKSFLASWPVISGMIRVVLLREEDGTWRPLVCTDLEASEEMIIQASTDRWGIEQSFHDLKEVERIAEVQLRRYHSNIGGLNLNLWTHTLTELWAWRKSSSELVNRELSPWDDPNRRPSHADRRKSLKQWIMQQEYNRLDISTALHKRIHGYVEMLRIRVA